MKQKRFPIVLTCLTLVLAILVSGLSLPGWMLPLLGAKAPAGTEEPPQQSEALGHSQPFSAQPVEGITVSAKADALDRDRELRMAPASDEELSRVYETMGEALYDPILVMGAWEFDLGLADDELLPGDVELSVDLEALGIPEEYYGAVCLYRVDDAGYWYEYASSREGSTLRAATRQNSLIVAGLTIGLILLGAAEGIDLGVKFANGGYASLFRDGYSVYVDGVKRFRLILDASAVMKIMKRSELGFTGHEKALLAEAEHQAVLEALKHSVLDKEQRDALKPSFDGKYTISGVCSQISKYDKVEAKILLKQATALCRGCIEKTLNSDPAYRKMQQQYEEFQSRADTRDLETLEQAIEQAKKIEEYLKLAYAYLRDEVKVDVHSYVMEVHMSAKADAGNYGAVVWRLLGNPYMLLQMERIGAGTRLQYDRLLLTIVHELFHASQRLYIAKPRANRGFDEMSAQCVEWEAYDYFSGEGVIASAADDVLENLAPCEHFAIPLDGYSTKYPEGSIGQDNDRASYARAPFLRWLREQHGTDYDRILRRYKGLSGHRYMTTILKACFGLSDQTLTENYLAYAKDDQSRFYSKAVQGGVNEVFAPLADTSSGKAEIKLLNKNYTIRVRRVLVPRRGDEDRQYALAIKYGDDYRDVMSDFELTPMQLTLYDDYKQWNDGLFIEARDFPAEDGKPGLYLLEADGGTAGTTEGYLYNSYSGYTLYPIYALPEPEMEVKNGTLSVKPPAPLEGAAAEIIDSVVITILLDQTQLAFEQMKYEGWQEPWQLELSSLKLNGQPLTQEQLGRLSFVWQQCVTGTFEYGPCLGPGERWPLAPDVDITGKWDMHSATNDLDLQWLYQYVEMMPEELRQLYGPYLEQLRNSSGDFVMEVSEAGPDAPYGYELRFVYPAETEAPPTLYTGSFDADKLLLRLEPKSDTLLSSGMELQVIVDGASLRIEGSAAYESELASYHAQLTGTKRPG